MGLFDQQGLFGNDPQQMSELGLIASLFSARQGDNIGLLLQNHANQLGQMQQRKQQQEMQAMQMTQLRRQGEQIRQRDLLAQRAFAPDQPMPEGQQGPPSPGGGGLQEYVQGLMRIDPQSGLAAQSQLAQMQAKERGTVKPGETVGTWLGNTFQPGFTSQPALPPGMRLGASGQPEYIPEYVAGQKDIRAAGANRIQTNVNAFTPASETAQAEFMKSTRTTYDQLKQAPVALDSIEKAKALVPGASGFMGPGGESLLNAAKFLNNRLGMNIDTQGVKNAEELRTRIFFNVLDNLKKMDAQPSQQQQKIMQEALGNIGTDPNALPAVLDAFAASIKGKIGLHNQEVSGAIQRGVKFPYDPIINLQSSSAGLQPQPADAKSSTNLKRNMTETYKARKAIKDGAPADQVKQMMIDNGFDPTGL